MTPTDVDARSSGHRSIAVTSVGETMSVLTPASNQALDRSTQLLLGVGGAESNTLMQLARLGHTTRLVTRFGDDPLGRQATRELAAAGVDVSGIVVDPDRRTGVYFKDPYATESAVYYYRTGSAASALTASDVGRLRVADSTLLYLTGITVALSTTCAELVDVAIAAARRGATPIAFDVNARPTLWTGRDAAGELLAIAGRCDMIFVGLDEATSLWGVTTPPAVKNLFEDGPSTIVVKDGPVGATEFLHGHATFAPIERVEIVEPVGAGDAFAAGYLDGWLRGEPSESRLLRGHRQAALALRSPGDVPMDSMQ